MAKITYLPEADDNDSSEVDGITFTAYQPVDLDPAVKNDLITKLAKNPWFARGELTDEQQARQDHWTKVRKAQAAAKAHRDHADALEADPAAASASDHLLADAQAKADGIVAAALKLQADAKAKADDVVAAATVQADALVAAAHTQADQIVATALAAVKPAEKPADPAAPAADPAATDAPQT